MEINYFKIPEITVTYKDTGITSKRGELKTILDAVEIFKVVFEDCMQHHEEAWAIFLSRSNKILGISCISKCGVHQCIIDVKIIMQIAIKSNAACIIVAHNHPSSLLKPSMEDINITRKIQNACRIFDIILFDHVIMTQEGFYSFAGEGIL